MPQISYFFGIAIYMYYKSKEHHPPHIHAYYAGFNATLRILDGTLLEGELPIRQFRLVQSWIAAHRQELMTMWTTQTFHKIVSKA